MSRPASLVRDRVVLLAMLFGALLVSPAVLAIEEGVRELRLPDVLVETDPVPELGFSVPQSSYPLGPVESLPLNGTSHGLVNTSTGDLVFGVADLRLPGRMPIAMSRVYHSGLADNLPTPLPGGNTDFGPGWLSGYTAYIYTSGAQKILATPEGDLIAWTSLGQGNYGRVTPSPSKHESLSGSGATFTEYWTDGTKLTYTSGVMANTSHGLTKIQDSSGNYVQLTYQSGYLLRIANSSGASVDVTRPMFDPNYPPVSFPTTRITKLTDSTGRQVLFDYDSTGRLTSVTDVLGKTWTFAYDSNEQLITATDPLSNVYLDASYDTQERVATYEADEGEWAFTYDTSLRKTTVEDGLSNGWEYAYNVKGITTSITEPTGGVHQLTLDASNNPSSYSGPAGLSASWTYDTKGRPLTYSPPGSGTNHITYTYFNRQVATQTNLDGGLTTFTRNGAGRVLTEETPDGAKWTATYASNGDRLTLRTPEGTALGSGYTWTFAYSSYGQIATATDPTSRVFEFDYTAHGDLWKFRRPDHRDGQGQLVKAEWIYARNAKGQLTTITDPLGHVWTRSYDDAGRLIGQEGPAGTSIVYGYDARHRLTSVKLIDGVTDPETTYTFDAAGRLATKTGPDGSTWTYSYDGTSRLTGVSDPLARTWTHGRDLAGRVTSITHPGNAVVTMTRDGAGRLTGRSFPGDRVETFTYDPATGRLLTAEVSLEAGSWIGRLEWVHDTMGRPTSITTIVDDGVERSRELQLTYDLNGNRETLTSLPVGETVTYKYDELDRLYRTLSDTYDDWLITYDPDSGRMKRAQPYGRWKEWTYDMVGRRLTERWYMDMATTGDRSFVWDAEGRLLSDTDNETGIVRQSQFNGLGLQTLYEEIDGSTTVETAFTYDVAGQITQTIRTEGAADPVTAIFDWDDAGRLIYARRDDAIRVYTWQDAPADAPSAAFRVWRGPTAPVEPTAELLYDFDGRLQRLNAHEPGEGSSVVLDTRWSPLPSALAFEATEIQSDATTATRWMAFDVNGYYAELNASFGDVNSVNPVAIILRSGDTLGASLGAPSPRSLAPFALGGWRGVPGLDRATASEALADAITGLIGGREEKGVVDLAQRMHPVSLATFDRVQPIVADVVDDWLGRLMTDGTRQGSDPVNRLRQSENSSMGPALPGSSQRGDWCRNRVCPGELPEGWACTCLPLMHFFQGEGDGNAYCGPCLPGGGGGDPEPDFPECDFAFDRFSGASEPLRQQDISEGSVSLVNGDFVQQETDLVVFDPGGNIGFSRTYRSGVNSGSYPLGYRWRSNWQEEILLADGGDSTCGQVYRWVDGSGQPVDFFNAGAYGWQTTPGAMHEIRIVDSTHIDIRHREGTRRRFEKVVGGNWYRLSTIEQGAQQLTLNYSPGGSLETITSNGIARLKFQYIPATETTPQQMKVVNGLDSNDWVEYTFNSCGELFEIRRPSTLLEVGGPAYQPKVTFTYQNPNAGDCNTAAAGTHLLTSISIEQFDPMAGISGPQVALTNIYSTPPEGASSGSNLKVIGQCFGAKACPATDPDLEYVYSSIPAFNGPHDTTVIDHRLVTEDVSTQHEFAGSTLLHMTEDEGLSRANRRTSYVGTGDGDTGRVTFGDGTCRETPGGTVWPTETRERTKARCDGAATGPPDRITYQTYEPFKKQVKTVTTTEAFPNGIIDFDPDDLEGCLDGGCSEGQLDLLEHITFFYYDFEEGYPPSAASECGLWNLPCPEIRGDLNGDPSDNDNWYGNVVLTRRWVPPDGVERVTGSVLETRWIYQADGRLYKKIGPDGVVAKYHYYTSAGIEDEGQGTGLQPWDWRGSHAVTQGPGGAGPVAELIITHGEETETLITRYAWSAQHLQVSLEDTQGVRVNRELARSGQILKETHCSGTCQPSTKLRTDRYTYDLRGRRIGERIDDAGGMEKYEAWTTFDDLGRPTTRTIDPDPAATPGAPGSSPGHLHLLASTQYDGPGRVIKTVSPEGRVTCHFYDRLGRRTRTARLAVLEGAEASCAGPLPMGSVEASVDYDVMDRAIAVTDGEGVTTWQWYDGHGRPEYASDGKPNGALTPSFGGGTGPTLPTSAGWWSQTAYDDMGRAIRERFWGRHDTSDPPPPDPDWLAADWRTYDALGRLTASYVGIAPDFVPSGAADSLEPPDPELFTDFDLAAGRVYYDAAGRRARVVDAGGRATNYEYDTFGRPKRSLGPADAADHRDTVDLDYDVFGRLERTTTTVFDPDGQGHERVGEVQYDVWGRPWRRVSGPTTEDLIAETTYDVLGRVTGEVRRWNTISTPELATGDRAVKRAYDAAGRLRWQWVRKPGEAWADTWDVGTEFQYDGDSLPLAMTDATGKRTDWLYDAVGRIDRMIYPAEDGKRQTVDYTVYDGASRPLEVQYREDDADNAARVTWMLMYDDQGRLTRREAAVQNQGTEALAFYGTESQEFGWDDLGRLVQALDHSGESDLAGAEDIDVRFSYDTAGRKLEENQRQPIDGTLKAHRVTSEYAADGFRTLVKFPAYGTGVRYAITSTPDARGRVDWIKAPTSPAAPDSTVTGLVQYEYVGGAVWNRSYRNGTELEARYDDLGRPIELRTTGQNAAFDFPDFRYGYDRVGNLTHEQRRHEANPAAGTYRTRLYTTDALGRLDAWSEAMLGTDPVLVTEADPARMPAAVAVSNGEAWSLDDVGNWQQRDFGPPTSPDSSETYTPNALNQYASVDPDAAGGSPAVAFVHDWLGQLREDPTKNQGYAWDLFGRLTKVMHVIPGTCADGGTPGTPTDDTCTHDGVTQCTTDSDCTQTSLVARYRYDALSRRVERYVPSPSNLPLTDQTTRLFYDGWRAIEERAVEWDGLASEEVVRARYGFGLGLDELLWMDRDVATSSGDPDPVGGTTDGTIESRYFVHHDYRGSAVAVSDDPLDGSGNPDPGAVQVIERFTYSAYGKPMAWWDPLWQGDGYDPLTQAGFSEIGLPYLYTGQRFDVESGLYYFKYRPYQPARGCFVRRDLVGYNDGPNLNVYAQAAPHVLDDPLGLMTARGHRESFHESAEMLNLPEDLSSYMLNALLDVDINPETTVWPPVHIVEHDLPFGSMFSLELSFVNNHHYHFGEAFDEAGLAQRAADPGTFEGGIQLVHYVGDVGLSVDGSGVGDGPHGPHAGNIFGHAIPADTRRLFRRPLTDPASETPLYLGRTAARISPILRTLASRFTRDTRGNLSYYYDYLATDGFHAEVKVIAKGGPPGLERLGTTARALENLVSKGSISPETAASTYLREYWDFAEETLNFSGSAFSERIAVGSSLQGLSMMRSLQGSLNYGGQMETFVGGVRSIDGGGFSGMDMGTIMNRWSNKD